MVQVCIAQNNSESPKYKRGVIHVRKKKVQQAAIPVAENEKFIMPMVINRPNLDIINPPCINMPWLKEDWVLKGFPNKAFSREYIIDAMHVVDCENVTLLYYINGDTTEVESQINFNEKESTVTFTYLENETEKILEFDYSLNIQSKKSNMQPPDGSYIAYDTTAVDILLFQKEKFIKYRLIWGKSNDPHSYFPGICKQEEDTVHQWISDQKDSDGFRHKLIFKSCSEIEVQYRNPKKKNRKEGFKVMEKTDGIHIELSRQRINVSDKYFNSEYTLQMKNDQLILENNIEKFTNSVYKK